MKSTLGKKKKHSRGVDNDEDGNDGNEKNIILKCEIIMNKERNLRTRKIRENKEEKRNSDRII